MRKNVKKQQKDILAGYLEDLKGISAVNATDLLECIEQAKALKDFAFREICNGNTDIMRFFTDYTKLIIDLYDALPKEEVAQEDAVTIEDGLRIILGSRNA